MNTVHKGSQFGTHPRKSEQDEVVDTEEGEGKTQGHSRLITEPNYEGNT